MSKNNDSLIRSDKWATSKIRHDQNSLKYEFLSTILMYNLTPSVYDGPCDII